MLKTSIVNTHDPYWKKCADEDPCATFYHTPSYTRLICDTFPGWENATLAFEDEKGVQAIFPMLKKKYWKDIPFYMYESVTQGVYGGPVFTSIGKSKTAEIEKIIVNKNNIRIISNPFSDWRINSKKFRSSPTFTQILNLQTNPSDRKFSKDERL